LTLERLSGLDTHPISTLHLCPASAGHFSRYITIMPGRSYLVFGNIEGKLEVLRVECTKCARKGRYSVGS
jgi:hypothetical protein